MRIEVWVALVSGVLGLLVTLPLWWEVWQTYRAAARVQTPDRQRLLAAASDDLFFETVRLTILLVYVVGSGLSLWMPGAYGRAILWALAFIPVAIAASSLYARAKRQEVREELRRVTQDSESA